MRRERILILEDDAHSRAQALTALSGRYYDVSLARSVDEALQTVGRVPVDLLLLSLTAPGVDALELLIRVRGIRGSPPVVVVSGLAEIQEATLAVKMGAAALLVRPFGPNELLGIVRTTLLGHRSGREREERFHSVALESAQLEVLQALTRALEAKDHYTGGHCERMESYAVTIGQRLGLSGRDQRLLRYCAVLHDIGKLAVPEAILKKNGKLTPEEYGVMKTHPEKGAEIIRGISFLVPVVPHIYYHQECYDGSGYPRGLVGEEIPLEARIVAVLDAYDAMTSDRPYRTALPVERAVQELRRCSGRQFDAAIVEIFVEVIEQEGSVRHQAANPDVSGCPVY